MHIVRKRGCVDKNTHQKGAAGREDMRLSRSDDECANRIAPLQARAITHDEPMSEVSRLV